MINALHACATRALMRLHKPQAPAVARDATPADRTTRHRARAARSAPLVASGEPTHPSTPLCCPGLLLSPGQGRCAWAPCGAHAFCLTRCPARARAGSNGSCTSRRGSDCRRTGSGRAVESSTGRRSSIFASARRLHQGEGGMGGRRRRPTRWRQWAKVRIICRRASTRSSTPG